MNGVSVNDDYLNFAQELANDSLSTLSNALDAMRNPALQVAERWSILADAYQSVFDSAFNKAVFYGGMADLAGNAPGAEHGDELLSHHEPWPCKKACWPIRPTRR